MTYLELVNAVLRRLRVSETGFVSDNDYTKLMGDFVNQAKREVEDAYPRWSALETELSVSVLTGVTSTDQLDANIKATEWVLEGNLVEEVNRLCSVG